jgi:rhodanese-related sulfurtransferase
MTRWFSRLTLNQRLALLAVVLGLVAVFAQPTRGGRVRIDPMELALGVQRDADHVRPQDLADWIIAGRSDYRLVDARDERSFAAYHVPTAENLPLASLAAADLGRNEKVVVYADGELQTAQAWFVLKAAGYSGVHVLDGGLAGWKDQVLYPVVQGGESSLTPADVERRTSVSRYFGGSPRAASSVSPTELGVPAGQAPAATASKLELPKGAKPAAPKKKKEGC